MLEKLAAGVVQVEKRKAAFGRQRTPDFYLGMGATASDHHMVRTVGAWSGTQQCLGHACCCMLVWLVYVAAAERGMGSPCAAVCLQWRMA
jgi:hypothetical protein